jgi:hypothetical protein
MEDTRLKTRMIVEEVKLHNLVPQLMEFVCLWVMRVGVVLCPGRLLCVLLMACRTVPTSVLTYDHVDPSVSVGWCWAPDVEVCLLLVHFWLILNVLPLCFVC